MEYPGMRFRSAAISAVCMLAVVTAAPADHQLRPRNTHVIRPMRIEASRKHIGELKLPPGFRLTVFAEVPHGPRMLAVSEDGAVYVTRPRSGDCLMLRDTNGDGRADRRTIVARAPVLHGIALHDSRVYLANVHTVYVAERRPDGTLGPLKEISGGLPERGEHPLRTLGVGPDGMLYISIGSTCNLCVESNPESATILRTGLNGGKREIFASGLRNTIGFGWHPQTREMWGMDNGVDWMGDNVPPEELNHLAQGAKYGWPFVYGDGKPYPNIEPPRGTTKEEWAKQSRNPVLAYAAHAAPIQLAFYDAAQFPPEYRGDAFVAMHGSWNREAPSGFEVVRVRFDNGKPVAIEPFLTGFLIQRSGNWFEFGRPAGVAVARDGSLLVSDDSNGVIYSISYGGTG